MQIVIDVPEEYNTRQLLHYFGCYSDKLDLVIYNGIPLPKGHGRLIDADDFFQMFKELDMEPYNDAPTIIEGGESDDSND